MISSNYLMCRGSCDVRQSFYTIMIHKLLIAKIICSTNSDKVSGIYTFTDEYWSVEDDVELDELMEWLG